MLLAAAFLALSCTQAHADELAVEAFLQGRLALPDIARVNATVLDRRPGLDADVNALLAADGIAREPAQNEIAALAGA